MNDAQQPHAAVPSTSLDAEPPMHQPLEPAEFVGVGHDAAVHNDSSVDFQLGRAEFFYQCEEFDAARTIYEQLWGQAAENLLLQNVVLHNLAAVYRQLGQWSAARSLQERAAQSIETVSTEFGGDAAELTNHGLDALAVGDYEFAEACFLRSLALERSRGNRAGEAADWGNLGVLAGMRGDLNVGMRFLGRAYRLHRELGDDHGTGTDLLNLAEFFAAAGRLSLAAKCLRRAVRSFRKCGVRRSLLEAEHRLDEIERVMDVVQRDPLLN